MMKRVYVAGPYSSDNVIEVLQNIGRGEALAAEVFNSGFAPFTPWHDKDFCMKLYDQTLTVKQFYDYSMSWLEVSDAIILVTGWEKSKGTLAEMDRAKTLGIPIFEKLCGLKTNQSFNKQRNNKMGFIREGGNLKWFGRCPVCKEVYRGIRKNQECNHRDCGGYVKMVNLNSKANMLVVIKLEEKIEQLQQKLSGEIPKLIESVDE